MDASPNDNKNYQNALASVESALARLRDCPKEEKENLQSDLSQLSDMYQKAVNGRIEIVLFGEISTGKSALINALVGEAVTEVDVQGGWTKEVWGTNWEGSGYRVPGLENSEIVLVDTPGINEVKGQQRAELAETTARRADLIIFVTDSDINETEYTALLELAAVNKPIILVLNKQDLYTEQQKSDLRKALISKVGDLVPNERLVETSAHPRAIEYVIEKEDGRESTEWKQPEPDIEQLKSLILKILQAEGLDLIALNAAMFAADKSDKIVALRVSMRNERATQVIWSFATTKALVVAFTPFPLFDIVGGLAVDALMVATLSRVYGINMSMNQSRGLAKAIAKAAGFLALSQLTEWSSSIFKGITGTMGTLVTAIPQGAAAGFSSYIVGTAAKHYFEHGGSWGGQSAKKVVRAILAETDRDSVLNNIKEEIRKRMQLNRHAKKSS